MPGDCPKPWSPGRIPSGDGPRCPDYPRQYRGESVSGRFSPLGWGGTDVSLMNGLFAPALFEQLAKFIEYFVTIQQLAALGLRSPTLKFRLQLLEGFIAFPFVTFEKTEGFAHNFAGGLVASGLHAALKKSIQFGSEGDVDGSAVRSHIPT